jgi:calcineurin-like phosphoesterase family protein
MAIWFISDTHFGHKNIIRYCNRPFKDIEEQTEEIVKNWNAVVSARDHVFHLGDVGYGSPQYLYRVLERLNGKIYLIKGNHDSAVIRNPASQRFEWIRDTHLFKAQVTGKTYRLFLSHYPHRSWPESNRGSFHLFGHTHGNMAPYGLSFDVGVDSNNYKPLSLEQVAERMSHMAIELDYAQRKPNS